MPPAPSITREAVLEAAVNLARSGGMESVNARALASALGCSTRPLFRLWRSMAELKRDVVAELNRLYNAFMDARMTDESRLVSQGAAYIEFARREPRIFDELFMNRCMEGASLADVAAAAWNRPTIENVERACGMSRPQAEAVFLNVWLFSHGLATQIASNHLDIGPDDAARLVADAFGSFAASAASAPPSDAPPEGGTQPCDRKETHA